MEYDLPEEYKICLECGGDYHVMRRETWRKLLIIPAQIKTGDPVCKVCACRDCKQDEYGMPIVKAPKAKRGSRAASRHRR